jgi:hypothetical protein
MGGMPRAKTTASYPVSRRALLLRINRALAHEGRVLHSTAPSGQPRMALGEFYMVEGRKVVAVHVDVLKLARELGVLKPHETATF